MVVVVNTVFRRTGRCSKGYGPAVWCVQVGTPPRLDPVEEQFSRVGRFLPDQLFQSTERRSVVGLLVVRFSRIPEPLDCGAEGFRPFNGREHSASHQSIGDA
jgi:hypothetical protein